MRGEIKLLCSFYAFPFFCLDTKESKNQDCLKKSYKSLLAHENKNLLQRCTLWLRTACFLFAYTHDFCFTQFFKRSDGWSLEGWKVWKFWML